MRTTKRPRIQKILYTDEMVLLKRTHAVKQRIAEIKKELNKDEIGVKYPYISLFGLEKRITESNVEHYQNADIIVYWK